MIRVSGGSMEGFIREALLKLNVDAFSAEHVSRGLTQTSLRGVDSHGVRLLPHYIRALQAGRINGNPGLRVESRFPATAVLHADHAFGHAAGAKAMEHAMDKASEFGVCAVGVRDSSHFGAAAYFALMAAEKGMIGMSFTNADALVLPHGGKRPFFGTNPVCFAAPTAEGAPFCLDMATSHYNWNKVMVARQSGSPLPPGMAADSEGRPTTDAEAARGLLAAGSYKGYGLGAMVDILCGVLTGMPYGPDILPMYTAPIEARRHIGHFFMALRVDGFQDEKSFRERMTEMRSRLRREPPADPDLPVLAANDPQIAAEEERSRDGIPLPPAEAEAFREIAEELGLPEP